MLNNFFKLNIPFEEFTSERFDSQLKTSKHICNVLYKSDIMEKKTVDETVFENVSFSKTRIKCCTFKKCTFNGCLFIGAYFDKVNFYDCKFINCNFFKCTMKELYAAPSQFRKSITTNEYANIAVHLYHQLRNNYYQESQREYKNEAEYFFAHWKRRYVHQKLKRQNVKKYKYLPVIIGSFLYDILFGYGYRIKNFVVTTLSLIIILVSINYYFFSCFFQGQESPSLIKSIYFTITTMATLGATGFTPFNETGYIVVTINVLFGISIFSAVINLILRKVMH